MDGTLLGWAEMSNVDFGSVEDAYDFFMSHSTEAASDAACHVDQLSGFAESRHSIHMLDMGCGQGDFTDRLLSSLSWPRSALNLTLVEPVERHCQNAAIRLASYTSNAIRQLKELSGPLASPVDLILSNHSLYFVDDLAATLSWVHDSLRPNGRGLIAIAGKETFVVQLWRIGFSELGRPVPYHLAEDVALELTRLGIDYSAKKVPYEMRFRDSLENRKKILRFLFGEFLTEIPLGPLHAAFDSHISNDEIRVATFCQHFAMRRNLST